MINGVCVTGLLSRRIMVTFLPLVTLISVTANNTSISDEHCFTSEVGEFWRNVLVQSSL